VLEANVEIKTNADEQAAERNEKLMIERR